MNRLEIARELLSLCRSQGMRIATVESCTGGMVASALTDIPGSSDIFERGFVTYSNASKAELLGVDATLIVKEGAVSEAVARAMAEGAIRHSRAELSVAITGIAGPDGGSDEKPVGLVYIATAWKNGDSLDTHCTRHIFTGDRAAIRQTATIEALAALKSRSSN